MIGDAKHGKGRHNRYFARQLQAPRLLLAATSLKLSHPISRQPLCINAPLQGCFAGLIRRFGWQDALPSEWLTDDAS